MFIIPTMVYLYLKRPLSSFALRNNQVRLGLNVSPFDCIKLHLLCIYKFFYLSPSTLISYVFPVPSLMIPI